MDFSSDNPMLRIQGRVGDIIQRMQSMEQRVGGRAGAITERFSTATPAPEHGAQRVGPDRPPEKATESSPGTPETVGGIPRSGFAAELEAMIQAEAGRSRVSPDLIRAVVETESAGKADAVSRAGAVGLMQLMPDTARELGVDPTDPQENLRGGVQYLTQMARQFGNLDETLAAYNAGPGAVKRHGGVPPYQETQDYVKRIRRILDEKR